MSACAGRSGRRRLVVIRHRPPGPPWRSGPAPRRCGSRASRQRPGRGGWPASTAGSPNRPSPSRRRARPARPAVSATSPSTPRCTGAVRADRGCVVVHLDHGGLRADQVAVPHRPHVQRAAPAHDQVGRADQLGGQRGGEPAAHVQVPGIAPEQALGRGRGGQQRAAGLGQPLQVAAGLGDAGAPPGDEHRPPGLASRAASASAASAGGRDRPEQRAAAGGGGSHSAACTSSGMASTTVRRCRGRSGRPGPCRRRPSRGSAAVPAPRRPRRPARPRRSGNWS